MSSTLNELLIFGYVRNIEKTLNFWYDIPIEIKLIIMKHYPEPFTFIKRDEDDNIEITDNGLSMTNPGKDWVFTQIGAFISKSDVIAVTLVLEYVEDDASRIAIGFITTEFNNWDLNRVNNGSNHSCMIYGDAILVTTNQDFKDEDSDGQDISFLHEFRPSFFANGHKLCIEIDMIKSIGRIWNMKDDTKVYQVNFKTDSVAFCVFAGPDTHTIKIVDQRCKYDK